MKLAALCSGGKDSIFSIYKAIQHGHTIECVVTIHPSADDSMLFHYPNNKIPRSLAHALDMPFIGIECTAASSNYAEIRVLEQAINQVRSTFDVEGIVHGAISSKFQNDIFRKVCARHGLASIAPIWNVQPYNYLQALIDNDFHVKIVSVSAMGLDFSWLGKDLDRELIEKLRLLHNKYGINMSFEGGEGETLIVDCPIFKKRLSIKKSITKWDGQRGIFEILEHELIPKGKRYA
jgi:ABC transporter with metal-binding/Fe-S-binding domain ATP-binding protein